MSELSITVRQMFPGEIERELIDRTIDVGLRRGVSTPTELAASVLGYGKLRPAVDSSHPLGGLRGLTLSGIAEFTLIVWEPPQHSFYTDFLVSACRRAGFEPALVVNPIQGAPPVTAVVGKGYAALVTALVTALEGQVLGAG